MIQGRRSGTAFISTNIEDGEPVISVAAFRLIMGRTHAGQVVKLEVRRGDKLTSIELTLAEPKKK